MPDAVKHRLFRQVLDGYVFSLPEPWPLAEPRQYLVSEPQKAEISSIVHSPAFTLLRAGLTVVAVMALAGYLWYGTPTAAELLLFPLVALVAIYVIACMSVGLLKLRLRRLLARLPRVAL